PARCRGTAGLSERRWPRGESTSSRLRDDARCSSPPRGRGAATRCLLLPAPVRPTSPRGPRPSWRPRAPSRPPGRAPPIGVPMLENLLRGYPGVGRTLPLANPLEHGVEGGAGCEVFQLLFEILLHRLAVFRRARGEFIADFLGYVSNRDLDA